MIVNNESTYVSLKNIVLDKKPIIIVVPSNHKMHSSINDISFVYYYVDGGSYILGQNHPDTYQSFEIVSPKIAFIHNKKDALNLLSAASNWDDLHSLHYVADKPYPEIDNYYTPWAKAFINTFDRYHKINVNNAIPLNIWDAMLTSFVKTLDIPQPEESFDFFNKKVIPTLSYIEKQGLYVNPEKFDIAFPSKKSLLNNSLVYSSYNPFTTTSRPSNANNGINFAALNKADMSREVFESRFGNDGMLLQIDFDSYHLRLLADYMNIPVSSGSIHTELAKEYFETDQITEEMYAASKQLTFQFLYGTEGTKESRGDWPVPELLKQIESNVAKIVDSYKKTGRITSVNGRKLIVPDPSPNKIFNYFVQCLEAEKTYELLYDIFEKTSAIEICPILYTYDSLLFDAKKTAVDDLMGILTAVIDQIKFPFKVSVGKNYRYMKEI